MTGRQWAGLAAIIGGILLLSIALSWGMAYGLYLPGLIVIGLAWYGVPQAFDWWRYQHGRIVMRRQLRRITRSTLERS